MLYAMRDMRCHVSSMSMWVLQVVMCADVAKDAVECIYNSYNDHFPSRITSLGTRSRCCELRLQRAGDKAPSAVGDVVTLGTVARWHKQSKDVSP